MQWVDSNQVENSLVWLLYSLASVGHRVHRTVLFVGGSGAYLLDQRLQVL